MAELLFEMTQVTDGTGHPAQNIEIAFCLIK
jgi:hypothetical protein